VVKGSRGQALSADLSDQAFAADPASGARNSACAEKMAFTAFRVHKMYRLCRLFGRVQGEWPEWFPGYFLLLDAKRSNFRFVKEGAKCSQRY
jgi:hypothetical protein